MVRAVRREVERDGTPPIAVIAKLNMADGSAAASISTSHCRRLDGCKTTAGRRHRADRRQLARQPDVPVSGRRARQEFVAAFKPPLRWGMRLVGKRFLRTYPYRETFLLRDAQRFRQELSIR